MTARLTKQGVRDLDPVGLNGHKRHACRHWFAGAHVVIGSRWATDPDYRDVYEEPIYGQKCMWCPAVREVG